MTKNKNQTPPNGTSYKTKCPSCDEISILPRLARDTFIFGEEEKAVELTAMVSVYSCENCGVEYTDDQGDEVRHNAVCKHLGVMLPEDIQKIRQKYKKSQADFASLSGIGKASINRWENGLLIQNNALDNFLFLLSFEENFQRIVDRWKKKNTAPETKDLSSFKVNEEEAKRFLALVVTLNKKTQKEAFQL